MDPTAKPLSVYQLTCRIKGILEQDAVLNGVWVEGEVSNLVKAGSGHLYFTLKDPKSTLKAALWAGTRRRVQTEFQNGSRVVVFGNISLYEPRGEYQLIVSDVRPVGLGALYEAFEKLKQKLAAEGLFDPQRKKPLPFLPRGIGIVTSSTGAVVKDLFRVIRRRFHNMPLFLVPTRVQGEGASAEIARGIRRLDEDKRIDVIIIARGGGSLEDLWAFNEETTARAVAEATKPVISAVGHETDTTIADFVADVRAATPSVAGELVVPVKDDLRKEILTRRQRLTRAMDARVRLLRERLARARSCRFLSRPYLWLSERKTRLANVSRELDQSFRGFFHQQNHRFRILSARLESLNPTAVLSRGFIFAVTESGEVAGCAAHLSPGDKLHLKFHDGEAGVTVNQVASPPKGGLNAQK
jgi:exodeoxyribonuclease VII large subunit